MDIPLDEVIYVEAIASSSTGAAADADSTPTFAVYEESTDTDIGVGGNMTKRTSLTGNYRASFTASAANGFELGKWYSVIGSATIGAVACKGVLTRFRIVAAEATAGYPVGTVKSGTGTGEISLSSGLVTLAGVTHTGAVIPTVTTLTNLPAITAGWLTATGIASGAITAAKFATDAIDSNALAASAVTEIWASVADSSGVTTLLSRLSSTRAGYLDNLSAGAVAQAATALSTTQWTNTRAGYLDNLSGGAVALAATALSTATWGSSLATALTTLAGHDPGATLGTSTLTQSQVTGGAYALNSASFGFNAALDFTTTQKAATLARVTLTDTATNLTNLPTIPTDWLTSNGLAASAVSEIQSGLATAASIAALNNISNANVLTQVETALASTTRSMPGQATPSTTPTLAAAIMQLFQQATNPSDQSTTLQQIYDRTGATVQQKRTVADSGSLFQLGALVTGP